VIEAPYPPGSVFVLEPPQPTIYQKVEVKGYFDLGPNVDLEVTLAPVGDDSFGPIISCQVSALTKRQPSGSAYVFSVEESKALEARRLAAANAAVANRSAGFPPEPWNVACDA
jgi:hypothetical protein